MTESAQWFHVTSGPKRALKKAPNGAEPQTDGHSDSMTESAQWGGFSENWYVNHGVGKE